MWSLYDPKLSARHVTDSGQRILLQVPMRASERGLRIVDDDCFVMLTLWSLLLWERKVGLVALERLGVDWLLLTRILDQLLTAKADENPVVCYQGVLVHERTRQPYTGWEFRAHFERLLGQAEHEALAMVHEYIGSEHLLLAVVRMASSEFATVLSKAGITYERVSKSVRETLAC